MSDASYSANSDNSSDSSTDDETQPQRIHATQTNNKRASAVTSVAPPHRKCIIRRCPKYRCRNRMCIRHNKQYSGNPPRHVMEGGQDHDNDGDDDSNHSPPRTTAETPSLAPHRYKLCLLQTCRSKIHEDVLECTHGMCRKHYDRYRGRDFPLNLMVKRNWRWSRRRLPRRKILDNDEGEEASDAIPPRAEDFRNVPIQNIAMLHSKLIHPNHEDCSSLTSGNSRMDSTVPEDDDREEMEEEASSPPAKKRAKPTAASGRYCRIRGCPRRVYSNVPEGMCRKHCLLFGRHPPAELKCPSSHGEERKDDDIDGDEAFRNDQETDGLYKAYYFARKNREWRLCHGGGGGRGERKAPTTRERFKREDGNFFGGEEGRYSDLAFPLEMQRKFAKVRRECIRQSKGERWVHVMKKQLGRPDSEKSIGSEMGLGKSSSLDGERRIPAALARQIVQNIREKDLTASDSMHDAVLAEARRVLGSQDDANGTSFANHLQQDWSYRCNDAPDWDGRGQGGDGQGNIYKHMSIDMIDDFVEWATSHAGKDQATPSVADAAQPAGAVEEDEAVYSSLLHVPKAPPPPSQIAFLRHRLTQKLVERFRVSYPHEDMDNHSKRAEELLACVDSSALVAIGIAIEEVMTSSLIPLAKAHVKRCRGLERLNNLQPKDGLEQEEKESTTHSCVDPFVAWTLPIAEAISALARDESTKHEPCTLLSSKPPNAVLNSDGSVRFMHSPAECKTCKEPISQWLRLHGINESDSFLKHDSKHAHLFHLLCSGGQ